MKKVLKIYIIGFLCLIILGSSFLKVTATPIYPDGFDPSLGGDITTISTITPTGDLGTGSETTNSLLNPLGDDSTIYDLIKRIAYEILVLAIPLAIIMFVVAGIRFMTSAGNEEKVTEARKQLVWTVVGLVVVFMGYALVDIIRNFLSS